MNWNNRVWKNTDANGNVSYGIFETYYNEAGEICGASQEPAKPIAEDTGKLKETLTRFANCLSKPLLDGSGFVFAKWDAALDNREDDASATFSDDGELIISLEVAPDDVEAAKKPAKGKK